MFHAIHLKILTNETKKKLQDLYRKELWVDYYLWTTQDSTLWMKSWMTSTVLKNNNNMLTTVSVAAHKITGASDNYMTCKLFKL